MKPYYKNFYALALCLVFTACSMPAIDNADKEIPFTQKKPNGGFENAYYVSFAYDSCGDEETGQAYRAKLRAKALHCPMPETSRAAFQRAATRMDDVMPEKIIAYHQQYGDHPEKSDDYECSQIVGKPNETLESVLAGGCPADQ